jgi:hypothetical protein
MVPFSGSTICPWKQAVLAARIESVVLLNNNPVGQCGGGFGAILRNFLDQCGLKW